MENKRKINILIVEDNPGDVRLIQEALHQSDKFAKIEHAKNGQEAINILNQEGDYKTFGKPDILLLDLNLPGKNGFDVLKELRRNPEFSLLTIIIFTSSGSPNDINKAYRNHANCFITKPVDYVQFFEVVKEIEDFWIDTAKLPSFA